LARGGLEEVWRTSYQKTKTPKRKRTQTKPPKNGWTPHLSTLPNRVPAVKKKEKRGAKEFERKQDEASLRQQTTARKRKSQKGET